MDKNAACLQRGIVIIGFCLTAGAVGADAAPSSREKKPLTARIADRDFPSVFQAWSGVENVAGKDELERTAMHDLVWHGVEWFGLQWDGEPRGLATVIRPDTIEPAQRVRARLLQLNPNIVLIAEIRYRDASESFLGKDHPWWMRDEQGRIMKGWEEGRFLRLDFANPEYRRHVARRAKAVMAAGVVDGVLLDWWSDDDDRLELVKEVRRAVGDEALIIANANDRTTPRTAPYINGYFMECWRSETPLDWQRIAETLRWAEAHLRPPVVNCVETWYHNSRKDLALMRAVTTLTLTHSNGYCLFSDPNPLPTPDHRHDWYAFWNKSLGKPVSQGATRPDGVVVREFEKGAVIYNPPGNTTATVAFDTPRQSLATGRACTVISIAAGDGDILVKMAMPTATH
jgi:hypothetical protein